MLGWQLSTHHVLTGGEAKLPLLAVTRHLRVVVEVICRSKGKVEDQFRHC
jgi:hypothetical protein